MTRRVPTANDRRLIAEFADALREGGDARVLFDMRNNPEPYLAELRRALREVRAAEARAESLAIEPESTRGETVPAHDLIADGDLLGFAGGAFGRDNYGPNECVHVFTLDGEPAAVFRTCPREWYETLVGDELRNALDADRKHVGE
ncbi:hypothetical protein [Curtobacterium sp. MCBD17_040]|uniref:hypothetical protein n=1 Tax=Curtobacterium sp. MCBD17_040 TaxID=2175674 RepID=UPI000DA7C180|nr:hypothetical protein [Curtobacterium sp. MCBD17_040]WIB65827.1 hypothetical protein DEI94_17075 [Curtobacterium sp. MCBD17_040]